MKKVVFDISKENASSLAEQLKSNRPNSVLTLASVGSEFSVLEAKKVGKYKGYHRIQMDVLIPEEDIIGTQPLNDLAVGILLSIPENRVQPHLIKNKK